MAGGGEVLSSQCCHMAPQGLAAGDVGPWSSGSLPCGLQLWLELSKDLQQADLQLGVGKGVLRPFCFGTASS